MIDSIFLVKIRYKVIIQNQQGIEVLEACLKEREGKMPK